MTDRAIDALLIEDNPLDARLIREYLSEVNGARVVLECADCLSAGVERLRKAPPDVLLLDLGLPESQGLDTLSRVLAEAPRAPVVVITGLDDEGTAYEAVAEGAQDYLVKGRVDGELLVRAMRYAIERQRAEEALRESDERYRALVENANDIVYSHDLEGRFTSVNLAGCRVYEYTTEEILGMNIAQIIDPEFLPLAQRMVKRKLAGMTGTGPYELLTRNKSGEPIWVEVNTRLRQREGQPVEVQGIARDITERKRMDEAFRRERDRAQQYLDLAPVVFVALNPQGEITLVNKRGCELLGRDEAHILGQNWFDTFVPQAARGETRRVFAQLMAGDVEPAEYYENPVVTSTGEEKIIAWHNRVLKNGAGTIVGTLSSGSDITERKRAAQALQRLMDFNESIIQNMAELIVVTNSQGDIIFANPACASLLGYTVEELVGLHWTQLVPSYHHGTVTAADERRTLGETGHYELELLRQDGDSVPVLVSGSPRFQAGQFAGTLAVFTDITERKRVEQQLRLSRDRLQEALNQTVMALSAAVETRDPYTAGHQRGVAELAVDIAREMGLPEDQISGIRIAGLVHDIGKIQIPAEILSKPTRLTAPEWSMMKAHPHAGHDILKTVEFPWPVSQIVLQHHERLDGSGYPQGLSGDGILLEARILAVADVVEAMASHRPYRPAHTLEETMEEIQSKRGTLYDPEAVDACVRLHTDKRLRIGQAPTAVT
jgi:PAS domain S-box-containing protein